MPWKKLLAWATGQIDEALRQKLEFVLEENRVYRALLDRHSPHWRLQNAERKVLAEKGKPLGKLLQDVITIWTCTGLTTFYVLFFLQLQTHRVILAGITPFPNQAWLKQIARNLTTEDAPMAKARFLLHDRDAKFSEGFDAVLQTAGIEPLKLPPQSPNLNAFAERWVRSVKDECLDRLILLGERALRHALQEYLAHHQHERNHQGLANVIPFADERSVLAQGKIIKAERLGGLLNFYHRAAA